MGELVKHIKEYFNTFNHKDYTIYVDGTPTEQCSLNSNDNLVAWRIPSDNNEPDWYFIKVREIEAIRLTPTTMEIIKTNGKEYKLEAKPKAKEEKAKEIIFWAKMSLYSHDYDDVLKNLDKLKALMNEP